MLLGPFRHSSTFSSSTSSSAFASTSSSSTSSATSSSSTSSSATSSSTSSSATFSSLSDYPNHPRPHHHPFHRHHHHHQPHYHTLSSHSSHTVWGLLPGYLFKPQHDTAVSLPCAYSLDIAVPPLCYCTMTLPGFSHAALNSGGKRHVG